MAGPGALTYDDLFAFPDDDGIRRELIDGELIESPSPVTRHQEILLRLALRIGNAVERRGGGRLFIAPLDVLLSPRDVVEPDLFFIADDRLEIIKEKHVVGVPSLMVEVLSNPRLDRLRKRDLYARFGVPEYWIVDPDADRVEAYRLDANTYGKPEILEPGETLTFGPLPGLAIDLGELFAR